VSLRRQPAVPVGADRAFDPKTTDALMAGRCGAHRAQACEVSRRIRIATKDRTPR